MNSLPPLPLVDGALFVDNSMLELLTTCPRALEYNKLHKRIGAVAKPALNFGTAIHLALEHRYKTYTNREPDDQLNSEIASLLTKHFDLNTQPIDDYRTLNWAMEIVKKYNDKYRHEPFQLLTDGEGKPMVELSFALPLFTWRGQVWEHERPELGGSFKKNVEIPVIYTGRIDLPVLWDDQLFIMDHKTTSVLGSQFTDSMRMSAQQKGYAWSFQELTGKKVTGYAVNIIRVKEPPQYLTDPNAIRRGKAQSPAQWWNESLQRERYYLRDGELAEWKANTIALIEEFFWHYQRRFMPQKTAWCAKFGRCQYFDVCSLPESDRNLSLESGLFTENNWSPLKNPIDTLS